MKCPFPGMDPYLEDPAVWEDFHRRLITFCADALQSGLPGGYDARIDERLRVISASGDPVSFLPDVGISIQSSTRSGARSSAGAVATLDPVSLEVDVVAEIRESWIEIRRGDRELVTIIEILSPGNKTAEGVIEYRATRSAILGEMVNLVEIDLLIAGNRMIDPRKLPAKDYFVFVTRARSRRQIDAYGWTIQDPLPTIPIPLRMPDPDIGLNLAEVFASTFERGRYERALQYTRPPLVSLREEQLAFVRQRLPSAT